MRQKKTIILMIMLIISITGMSQSKKSISVFTGSSDNGFATMFNFQIYPDYVFENFYEIGVYSGYLKEIKSEYEIPLKVHTLNAGYLFRMNPISSISNSIITRVGLGGVIGLEKLNNGEKELPNGVLIISDDGLIYGCYGAIETDFYLSKNWSLLGRYTHFYHVNSDVGKFKFMVGIGLKYIFI